MSCFICERNGSKVCGQHCGLCPKHDDDNRSVEKIMQAVKEIGTVEEGTFFAACRKLGTLLWSLEPDGRIATDMSTKYETFNFLSKPNAGHTRLEINEILLRFNTPR